ncbi:MAG: Succinate-semialdehyde dehydrogenase [NAD]; Succinate-semialdehyde dehydrogenase [NADP+], partial [uncultured Corynebacteriales bacterium]
GDRDDQPGDRRDGPHLRAAVRRGAGRPAGAGGRRRPRLPADDGRGAGRLAAGGRRRAGRGRRRGRPADDAGDGQDAGRGEGRGGEVRDRAALLRRARPGVPGADAGRRGRGRRLGRVRGVPADRGGAGDHAVELPALAGDAVRRAGADGRQRGPAQARQQRPADRAVPGRAVHPGRLPGRRVPDPADLRQGRGDRAARRPGRRRHAHRLRPGRALGGRDRRGRAEEDRAGAGRQRPVPGDALGRPAAGGGGRGHRPLPEQRPELHRRQALPGARGGGRRVRAAVRRGAGRAAGRRPDGGRHRRRPTGHRIRPRRRGGVRRRRRRPRRPGRRRRDPPARAGLVLPAHPGRRPDPGDADVPRRGLRAGRRAPPGAGPGRGDRAGQRHRVRPRGDDLDHRRRRAGPVRRRGRGRDGLRQRHGHLLPAAAVRRGEDQRVRPGADRAGPARVRQREVGLGGL